MENLDPDPHLWFTGFFKSWIRISLDPKHLKTDPIISTIKSSRFVSIREAVKKVLFNGCATLKDTTIKKDTFFAASLKNITYFYRTWV